LAEVCAFSAYGLVTLFVSPQCYGKMVRVIVMKPSELMDNGSVDIMKIFVELSENFFLNYIFLLLWESECIPYRYCFVKFDFIAV